MANWILTHTDRFACIVSHDGMFNPQSAYGTTEELWLTSGSSKAAGDGGEGQGEAGGEWAGSAVELFG